MNNDKWQIPFEDDNFPPQGQYSNQIYDKIPIKADVITVQFDSIDSYSPFKNNEITLDTENINPSSSSVAVKTFQNWQDGVEMKSQKLFELSEHETATEGRPNNFPPFPRKCPLKPCFYQDIDVDIPENCKSMVKFGYTLWICYSVSLVLNVIGTTVVIITFNGVEGFSMNVPTLFGVSIALLVLFVPLSYLLWFRRLYFAFKTNSSLEFLIFFFVFSLCIISLIIEVIGIPQCGVCGWIIVVMTKSKKGVMGFMTFIATVFMLMIIACSLLLLRVNIYFRSSGGSLIKAKEELRNIIRSGPNISSVARGVPLSR